MPDYQRIEDTKKVTIIDTKLRVPKNVIQGFIEEWVLRKIIGK